MAESLKNKTIKGVGWSAVDAFLGQGVLLLVGIVLARLLSPEEYGLIGIVTIFTTVMYGIMDSGFSSALIRKQDITNEDYNTLFFFNLAVSVVMFALLFAGAPWIARFFERPQLLTLVRVMGSILILQSLCIVHETILKRQIDFKTKTKASFISAVTSGIVGIGMAFAGCGVWSLAGQQLSRQLVYSVCLWVLNRWRPKRKVSFDSLRYMWWFGWKLLLSGLLNNFWLELKKVVVSKFYSPAMLGQYSKAGEFAKIFSANFTSIIQRVTYPALAKVQDDKTRMVSAYRRVIKTTMFVTVICMFFLGAVSEPLFYCLIGPKWHVAATFLPLICIARSIYPLQAINLNMLKVQGLTDIYLYLEIAKKAILLIPLFIGAFIGIYWMLVASIGTSVVAFFLNSYYSGKALHYSSWMQLKDVAPSYGIGIIVALSVYFLKNLPITYWIVLPMQMIVGMSVFFLLCEKTRLSEYNEVKDVVAKNILKKKNSTQK
ncbi:MAG: lipopolysaccharide biosynthesis protein [Prevotella sp.]|nr:lipopolysaccharide biosynthesis protein [Prevotella sp.]